jgi:lactocepin
MALLNQRMNEFKVDNNLNLSGEEKSKLSKALLVNTAVPKLDPAAENKTYFSPRRQGAGLVDAEAAVKNTITITDENGKPSVALKEILDKTKSFKLKLKNYGKNDATYTVEDLSGVQTEQTAKEIDTMSYDVKVDGATVTFDKNEITVPAGQEAYVTITLNLPESPTNNFIEGYIRFNPKSNELPVLGSAYMGFYGKWGELPI